ncbi:uncharacterized protein I303_106626 [Kwoniella dejecticola CBS 10117]|uniref:Uncharacterized protein n=1 Tax=Kwoniella dejecticola CBS 10117 TaxID=1296121 RepID=A0A1A5ZU73_9TREE|nr:uncharacterized protein I303_08115 [Kwoniella dejecticola CBS 10117]OBR81345.1 hypothetical protein I303_08115 [Kwoniella dejecticola CBS 10117]
MSSDSQSSDEPYHWLKGSPGTSPRLVPEIEFHYDQLPIHDNLDAELAGAVCEQFHETIKEKGPFGSLDEYTTALLDTKHTVLIARSKQAVANWKAARTAWNQLDTTGYGYSLGKATPSTIRGLLECRSAPGRVTLPTLTDIRQAKSIADYASQDAEEGRKHEYFSSVEEELSYFQKLSARDLNDVDPFRILDLDNWERAEYERENWVDFRAIKAFAHSIDVSQASQ